MARVVLLNQAQPVLVGLVAMSVEDEEYVLGRLAVVFDITHVRVLEMAILEERLANKGINRSSPVFCKRLLRKLVQQVEKNMHVGTGGCLIITGLTVEKDTRAIAALIARYGSLWSTSVETCATLGINVVDVSSSDLLSAACARMLNPRRS